MNLLADVKLCVQTESMSKPPWLTAAIIFPPPPMPELLTKAEKKRWDKTINLPEERFKNVFENRNPHTVGKAMFNDPLDPGLGNASFPIGQLLPRDNRWYERPSETFALRQLDYVNKGYSEKESYEKVEREFQQRRAELEIEKEIAARQAEERGIPRKNAADVLKYIRTQFGYGSLVQAKRVKLEDYMNTKKPRIKAGIFPRITPKQLSPSDAEFYLRCHPYDKGYFDSASYISHEVMSLAESKFENVADDKVAMEEAKREAKKYILAKRGTKLRLD